MAPVLTDGTQIALETRPFQAEMVDYIKAHFGDMLGPDAALLETPEGLDALCAKLHAMTAVLAAKRIA
jgi:hypothetical protein